MDCTGYACPPGNKVPAGDVIVNLATTGADPGMVAGGVVTAVLLMLGAGILFTYNHLRNKERKK